MHVTNIVFLSFMIVHRPGGTGSRLCPNGDSLRKFAIFLFQNNHHLMKISSALFGNSSNDDYFWGVKVNGNANWVRRPKRPGRVS